MHGRPVRSLPPARREGDGMECREARILISPYLDGVLSKGEEAALTDHMAACEECSREMSFYRRLSATLWEVGREDTQAPPELCGLVMGKLRAERRTVSKRLPAAWRRSIAAAAAILLLAGGSAGITIGLKPAGVGQMIGLSVPTPVSPEVNVDTGGDNAAQGSGQNTPGAGHSVQPPGDVTFQGSTQGGTAGKGAGDDNTGTPNTGVSGTPVAPGEKTAGTATALSTDGERAFTSKEFKVVSTILKINVGNLPEARIKAVSLAAGTGTSTQVFPEQSGDKQVVVVRLTVASADAPGLIAGLTMLGEVFDRQDESRDFTSLYNETMVQYLNLQSRISSAGDTAEQRELEAQAASLKQQLDVWEAEAGKRVIMLWLENN